MDQPPDVDLDAPMSNPEEEEDRRHHEHSEESEPELEGDLEDRREEETIMERIQRRKEFEASSQHHLATMLKNENNNHSHSPPEYLYPYGYLTPQHAAALAMVQGLQQQVSLPPQQPLSAASSLTGGSAGSPPNNGLDSPRGPQSEQDQSKYTYEEQFKQPMNSGTRISADDKGSFQQLYELSDDPRRKEFLDDLFSYMQKRGTPVNRIPIMAKQVLDLFELYRLVVARGGLVEVINKKIWREITKGLNLPSSITSAAFTLRTQYMKYLYPYECVKEKLSTNEELQAAIDGNKREGRRSSYGPYSDLVPAAAPRNPMGALMRPVNGHGPPAGGRASVSPLPLAYFAAAQQHNATTHLPLNLKQENGIYGNHTLSSGEEDNCNSIPSTPNPMAMPQQEALNLEVSRSSSTTTTTTHNNNNNNSGEHKPLNMARKHYDDNGGPTPAKRPMTDHLNISTTNIKISNRSSDGRSQENAITVTMDVNGVLYQGMLFATNHRTRL